MLFMCLWLKWVVMDYFLNWVMIFFFGKIIYYYCFKKFNKKGIFDLIRKVFVWIDRIILSKCSWFFIVMFVCCI